MNQQPPWPAQQQPQSSQKMPLPRTNGRILLKILLYFVGAVIAEFGLLTVALTATSSSGPLGGLAFSFGLLTLIGSTIVFFQKKYYVHCLAGFQYLWWILGATTTTFAA